VPGRHPAAEVMLDVSSVPFELALPFDHRAWHCDARSPSHCSL
jgi:hypothetical protein